MRFPATSRLLTAICLAVISASPLLAAGGSYVVDDFDIDDPGVCNIESAYAMGSNGDAVAVANPGCVIKLGIPVEIDGQFQRSRAGGTWTSSAGANVKFTVLPMTRIIGVGLSGTAMWDTTTGAANTMNINVPATLQFDKAFRLNVNGGYLYDRTKRLFGKSDYGIPGASEV